MLLFLLAGALSVVFSMATALSVSDFLSLLFDKAESELPTAGNLLSLALNKLYVYLISFGQMKALLLFSLLVFLLYTCKNVFGYFSSLLLSVIRSKVICDVRNELFDKSMRLSAAYHSRSKKGDVLARFGSDITEYEENVIVSIQTLLNAIISIVLYLAMLFYINLPLTLFVFAMLPVVIFGISGLSHRLRRQSKELQERNSRLVSLIEESMEGLKIIKAYTAIEFSNRRFQSENKQYTQLRNKVYRRIDLSSPVSEFLSSVVVIGILLFGSYLIFSGKGNLSPEMFVSYIMMFVLMIQPAKETSKAFSQIKKGRACVERLESFLQEPDEEPITVDGKPFEGVRKSIDFSDVSFQYVEGHPVLEHLSFTIPQGTTVALVGSSGSGKSTIADLLSRFYDPTDGKILIDGTPLTDFRIDQLRQHIGVVAQDALLFNDTIRNNIAYGCADATFEEIVEAARIANAHDFISAMPQGYDTQLGDSGSGLSGGQRQRICIARAIIRNPDILILDEATSALDSESERLVQQALENALKNRTALVIAHRFSTIVGVDNIIVLEHGRIVEQGTHQQLIQNHGRYYDLCYMLEQ